MQKFKQAMNAVAYTIVQVNVSECIGKSARKLASLCPDGEVISSLTTRTLLLSTGAIPPYAHMGNCFLFRRGGVLTHACQGV